MENCQDVSVLDAANLKNKVDYLESQLVEYKQVVEERDSLLKEVDELKDNIQELIANKEKLQEEHAEELVVLSSTFSQHFEDKNNNDNEEKVKEYEREIQKLRNCIEDKTYHINQLQKKLMKTQLEMENDLEKHESELENLRSQLEKLENSDTESLVEERMNELKESYEKEIQTLKEKLQAEEAVHLESNKDEQLNESLKEIKELKLKLKGLEDGLEERMEEEETKFRREVMTVKDKLIHQHQLEIDELLSQLERSNAEVEKLRRLSRQGDSENIASNQPVANGDISRNNIGAWNGLQTENGGDSDSFKLIPVQIEIQDPKMYEELDHIHALYQQQADLMCKRMKAQFQEELEDNNHRLEDDYEQQLERQRTEYEEKIVGVQKQLRAQHQSDLDRVTNDMEDQIQDLKNGHAEEIADLMQRLRGLSDERRRSFIEQDNTQQRVIVIKEEFKSKVESLEQELRMERQKVADYEEKLQDVEAQVQAFKNEKEQEVKYIEEELKKQCKLLVEKKAKELKEKYQSELNEKVNKVEKTLRKQYDEDSVRSRSELEESHRTLKEKYENEITDIMTQMEQVQQRNQEVFEAQQKEQFEKQLSLVMEELEPYKGKCQDLEKENKNLLDKYNRDLSELKVKMDEVEKRYSANEKIEQESLRNLGEELSLYKTKVKELEEGNKMLVVNYGAQLENMKKKYEEGEEGEVKTLQEEVTIYTKKVEKLQHENQSMSESYESQLQTLNEQILRMKTDLEEKDSAISKGQIEREELNKIVDELSKQLESYINNCAELEETKKALDNRHAEEIELLNEKMRQLDKDLQYHRSHCTDLENANKVMESEHAVAKDDMIRKIQLLERELVELRNNSSNDQDKRKNSTVDFEQTEKLTERIQELEQELLQQTHLHDNDVSQNKINREEVQTLTAKITQLEKSVEEFRHNCSELQEAKTSMENKHVVEKQELITKIEKQTALTGEREKELQIAIQDKQQLQGDLKKVEEELENSNNNFEVFKTEKQAVIAQQTSEINELTHELEKLNEQGRALSQGNLNEENERLQTEHKHLEVDLDNIRAENEQLLNEIKDAADRHKEKVNKLNEEVLSLREQETKQSKNLDKVQERYELLIVDLKDEIATQKGNISELEATNSQYVQEIASLVAEVERLQDTKETKPHNDSISSEESFTLKQEDTSSSQGNLQKYKDEIAELKAENEQYKALIQELEDEGDNKFGVLLSQHEKELEVLKEELEEQIARKREQLAKEATVKRQKLKEEYEAKLRVIYEELVTERSRSKDQFQQINQLSQKVKLLEGISIKQKKDIERVKQMEDKLKELERQSKKKDSDVESKEDDYKVNIQILEEKLGKLSNKVERTEKELNEAKEEVKSLQEELDIKRDEIDKLRGQLKNLPAREEAVVTEVENKVESQGDGYPSEEIKALIDRMKELEIAKAKEEKQSQEAALRNEKLQKDLRNMDKARQAVVQMYDEKIEAIGVELDDAVERGDVLRKQLEETKKMLRLKHKEMEEKQKTFSALENELKNEKDTVEHLKQKITELEEQLVSEKETKIEPERIGNEDVCEKLALLTTDLQNERESNSNLKHTIENQIQKIESQGQKLVEIKDVVMQKDHVISQCENKFKAVQEELILEKEKSSNLEKELEIIKDSKSSDVLESIEEMKKELRKQHEQSNEKLKESYESILYKKDEENRVKADEFQAEIVTLKGMVDNLEQLNQLKDEDKDIQLKELEERHEASMREHLEVFDKEKKDLERKLMEVTSEDNVRGSKVDELVLQIQTLTEEQETLKNTYENEIQTLKNQLDFESSFQVELQESFQNELKTNMEKQSLEHKNEIERVNAELQQKMKELEEKKTEHATLQNELEESKKVLETHALEIKDLEDRIVESKVKHEEEVLDLKSKLETLSNKEEVVENNANDELITSLRTDNKGLSEEIQRLQGEIEEKEIAHQEEIAFITSELEMRSHQREDDVNRCHSQELDSLMTRLEFLVQKENDSKALTQSHMHEITSVRNEMEQRIERLAREKEREVEAGRRALEDHYIGKQRELQEKLNSKCQEVMELQQMVRTLKNKVESSHEQSTEELSRLRQENAELYRKLREASPKQGRVVNDTNEMTDNLRTENKKLQREIENLKTTMQRQTKTVAGESSESTRLSQLVKVMEQLMTEKNDLEMKLRRDILELKTQFGDLGEVGSSSSANLSSVSLSPEGVSRESLLDMLQDLRASKRKQEEEIQAHIREIERMIDDIRKKIRSTEFADHRIQEMLANQLQHLEKQRKLLVNRLVKLREKHDSVEQKLTQQIAGMSAQSSPDRDELIKSKWYQNLLEENLKKEKELLVMKRQQVNDLQTKLSLEKAMMERKVAERHKLKQQLSEKNKQESELSLERSELEKKWMDNLKMREIELKQETTDLRSRTRLMDSQDSIADRISGLISRSSAAVPDDKHKTALSRFNYSPITSSTVSEAQQSLNRYSLLREARTDPRSSMAASLTTKETPSTYYQYRLSYDNTGRSSLSRYRTSKRTDRDEFKMLPNEVPKQMPRNSLDLSSDDELDEFAPSSNEDSLYWEMDIKNDSDVASISPESTSTLEGIEKNWEKNLEEELRQISAGTLKVLPSGRFKESTPRRENTSVGQPGATRNQNELSSRDFSTSTLSYDRLSQRENTSRRYENYRPGENFPRSSTALPGEEHEQWLHRNGSFNVSQIPSVLPTLLNDIKIKGTSRREIEERESEYRDSMKYRGTPTQEDRNRSRVTLSSMRNEDRNGSPNSSKSEPTRKTSDRSQTSQTADGRDRSSVFLLNYDDYIDRHQVRSSDKVASLRDLSPSEKYSLC